MAIAFDASSESHAGTTGSSSEASFSWTHTPVGTPKGVLVFTFVNANADEVSAVTYGGVSLSTDAAWRAVDTADEPGDCKAWFLGSGVPTGSQSVVVTRTNNATVVYAVAITVTSGANSEVHSAGVTLVQNDGTCSEVSVTDGSPGQDSVRFAGINSGLSNVQSLSPPVFPGPNVLANGDNSTLLQSIVIGSSRSCAVVRETTAGQGSRSIGFRSVTSDDRAAVHLAVRETSGSPATSIKDIISRGILVRAR
jgi:hypothetical protein